MRWPPYKHIFFDCDSTLTTVEGIDILAETAGKKWRVEVLTKAAMDGDLDLEDVYAKRLRAVKPTRGQIQQIRRVYKRNIVEDAKEVITVLQELGHKVYIISGGLAEPVEEFGIYLGVPREQIRAVGVAYNQLSGTWWQQSNAGDFKAQYLEYEEGALTVSDGKAKIVEELLGNGRLENGRSAHSRSLLIGDGISDLLASRAVDLFVGFGGVVARDRVLQEAPAFIHSASMTPLLALAAGPAIFASADYHTNQPYAALFNKAVNLIQTGALTFQNERLKTKFNDACRASFPTCQTIHSGTS